MATAAAQAVAAEAIALREVSVDLGRPARPVGHDVDAFKREDPLAAHV
jgi:hypothetical protein